MTTLLDVAQGLDSKRSVVRVFGRRSNIGTSEHDVSGASEASGGATSVALPTGAAVVSIVSDNAADAVAGNGARSVRVFGLDANWDEKEVVVALNGTTPALSTDTLIRVNDVRVEGAGSGGVNTGTLLASIGGQVQAAILPGVGSAQQARYSVPRNKVAYILRRWVRTSGSSEATAHFWERRALSATSPKIATDQHRGIYLALVEEFKAPLEVPPKSDLWVTAQVDTSTAWVAAGFDLLLVSTGE